MQFIKILRIEQWSKNLVIFLPTILSKNFQNLLNTRMYLVFFCFSIMVSATYIFNDIRDADQDIQHPEKKNRPIASGTISKNIATKYGLTLLFLSLIAAYSIQKQLTIYFSIYLIITTLYSIKFKYKKYLDFMSISVLFYLRIMTGAIDLMLDFTNYFIIFIISTLTIIAIGKKYSILIDPFIPVTTKVKKHLKNSYQEKELRLLLITFSIVCCSTYILWLYENLEDNALYYIFSVFGIVSLLIFLINFFQSSVSHQTENFVTWLLKPKNLFNVIILSLVSLLIIY